MTATPSATLLRHVVNPIVSAILRSPLHRLLSRRVMLITVAGRRTGRRYTLPVAYVNQPGTLDVLIADNQRAALQVPPRCGHSEDLSASSQTGNGRDEHL